MTGLALITLLLQVLTILAATGLCGWIATRLKQPRVVGEIAGGLLLGPLALSHLFPTTAASLFATSKLAPLETLSYLGLVLFLFLMGTELDLEAVRKNRGATLTITVGSIGLPFALGALLAPTLLAHFGMGNASRAGFILFIGIAMSITAMPVLARILQDRDEAGKPIDPTVGSMSMVCAAANDLLGWTLLAITLSILHDGTEATGSALRLSLLPIYIAVMFFLIRPIARIAFERRSPPTWLWLPVMIAIAFASAHITDTLGIHAFLGAFLAGACMPRAPRITQKLHQFLQPVIRIALPIFFAMTGLKMQREAFATNGWAWLAIILIIAVIGKIGGSLLGAKASGMQWKQSTQIGILLNTRGLVELIVLNIGYKEGILGPTLFTLFVLMALITTLMTAPLFDLSTRISDAA